MVDLLNVFIRGPFSLDAEPVKVEFGVGFNR
jgi:hypothetical protein